MNHKNNHKNNHNQIEQTKFDDKGNRETDLVDGLTITALMTLVIAGIIYFLYTA